MKKIIWIVLIVIVAVAVYYYVLPKPEPESVQEEVVTESVEVSGVVSEVDTDAVALDGPALVTIQADGDVEHVVAVPSMGINLCAAVEDIADVYTLMVGEQVSVRGELDEEGRIVPCVDSSHYLRTE